MIFADKLIQLRKKSGWSQEELAEQLNVTRQSVSKWEGAQSVPDLEKLLRLSELFGVSMDYLLKDSIEEPENTVPTDVMPSPVRRVSMEEASAFLHAKESTARPIALATFLCILSPICFLILGAACEVPGHILSENAGAGLGMIVLLAFVAAAVAIFIPCGTRTAPFEYLEKEIFETEYGVTGMVKERKEKYKATYTRNNIIGTCICILSLVPLFTGLGINDEDDLLLATMLSATLVLAGVGVFFFIRAGIIQESFEKLLQEGDYTRLNKKNRPLMTTVAVVYWLTATAVFLVYIYMLRKNITSTGISYNGCWIIWAVAGVLYPAVSAVTRMLASRKRKDS